MNTTSPQQQATVDTKQLESLIEEGNSFFKVQKWNEAKQKYSLAIGLIQNLNEIFQQQQGSFKYLEQQWIRVHNNRAQVHLMLKEYNESLADCQQVLKFDPLNEKAIIRLVQSLNFSGSKELAFEALLNGLMKSPGNDKLEALKALFPNFLDLHDLIALGCEQTNKYIFSVKQLKGIEHKAYHDTWRVEDYFDPTNENRCFDIPCPTDQFFVDNALIEKEKQYFENLSKKNKGTFPQLFDYGNVYCRKPQIANDPEFPLTFQYYYKFSHGEKKPLGFANVAWLRSLFKLQANKKDLFILLPQNQNMDSWALYKVKDFGLQFGNVRCKSTNWYAIHRGDVVVRDFDKHIWSLLILESVDPSKQNNTIELFIDFMGPQFNHFDYLLRNKLPCKIFTRETIQQEEATYHEDYIGTYRMKDRKIGKDAKNFIDLSYVVEFPLEPYSSTLLSKLEQAYLYEFKARNYIPKPQSLF
nr:unnamed protein product [Naegleria fowleri]